MAIAFLFELPGVTQSQYDAIIARLKKEGASAPPGRSYHVAGPTAQGWRVVDVWETQQAFDRFFQGHLQAAIQEQKITAPQISTWTVHNIVRG
jgi:hypothetical protein